MNNILNQEMSQEEFQFCKEELKNNVKQYFEIDDD